MPYSIVTRDGIKISGIPDDVPKDSPELKQRVQDARRNLQAEKTPQQIALDAGAQPGVALTTLQKQAIDRGERIQPQESSLERASQQGDFAPIAETDQGAFSAGVEKGLINIGSGMLRAFNEVKSQLGDEGARKFLQDLDIATTVQESRTQKQTEGSPISRFAGEVLGETLGFPIGGAGKSLLQRIASGFAAGAGGSALSAGGRGLTGEEVTSEALIGGAVGSGLEGIGTVRRARQERINRASLGGVETDDVGTTIQNIRGAEEAQAQTGIRAFPAQKTLNPFQLEQQSFIGQSQESSEKAFNALKAQNREAGEAVKNLLEQISTPDIAETAAGASRRKSKGIIKAKEAIRAEATSAIYKQAFRRQRQGLTPKVNTDSLINKNNGVIRGFGDSNDISKPLKKFGKEIEQADGDLKKLHGIKMQIDDALEKKLNDTSSIGSTAGKFLTGLQKDLVNTMNQASPSYNAARQEFARLSPQVDAIRDGVFGKISKLKDLDLQKASKIIFDGTLPIKTSVQAIKTLKGVQGGQDVASGLVRNEIERRLSTLKNTLTETTATGGRNVENIPQDLLNKLFGKGKQKDVLFATLNEISPQAAKNAQWLQTSLKRASAGRPGGSQTGIRAEIRDKLKGIGFAIRNVFRSPVDSISGIGEDAIYARNTRALGDVLYDPSWQSDMNALTRLDPNSQEAQSRFEKLLRKVVDTNETLLTTRQAAIASQRKERELAATSDEIARRQDEQQDRAQ